jgi:tetratricopeptide (TPR) repeat protein
MAKKWAAFPHADPSYAYAGAALKKAWTRLHKGDREPFPADAAVADAWRHFHAGAFRQAVDAGRAAGGAGVHAAVKAQCVYAHYLYAYALGRYGQGISVAKALAQGFGGKIRDALATALALDAKHAEAAVAFGAYQAEVINKVGALVAGLTYGAKKESALAHFEQAVKLFPESPIVRIEHANGLLLLFGNSRLGDATKLYEAAAAATPEDAMERLDVEHAKRELA